jgi:hypothetical protein
VVLVAGRVVVSKAVVAGLAAAAHQAAGDPARAFTCNSNQALRF